MISQMAAADGGEPTLAEGHFCQQTTWHRAKQEHLSELMGHGDI